MMDTINVKFREHGGAGGGVITLASHTPRTFLNIYTSDFCGSTVHADDAKALRDALIKIYPLPAITAEPSEYTTRFMFGRWEIVHEVPSTDTAVVGYADDSESAARIAQALNETEGL